MNRVYRLITLVLIASTSGFSHADNNLVVKSDESKFPIPLNEFSIDTEWLNNYSAPLLVSVSPGSLAWKKFDDGNKLPQLILSITIDEKDFIHFKYQNKIYIPEQKQHKHLLISTDVFSLETVKIIKDGKVVGKIKVSPDPQYFKNRYVYLDHSCTPYNVHLNTSHDRFTSLSCHFYPSPKRKGVLDVNYLPAESRINDISDPPYKIQLTGEGVSKISLHHPTTNFTTTIQAKIPDYVPKMKTALGFGPYYLKTSENTVSTEDTLSAAYMIYGKYDLSPTTSLRFFDALLNSGAFFNNAGGYFAYEVGSTQDKRISIVPLLGFQAISFRVEKDAKTFHQTIFPQGGEIIYKHAFGFKNYHLVYGMFVQSSSRLNYKNIWIRYGKKMFWELNWIDWRTSNAEATMWGVSVGLPFLSF